MGKETSLGEEKIRASLNGAEGGEIEHITSAFQKIKSLSRKNLLGRENLDGGSPVRTKATKNDTLG